MLIIILKNGLQNISLHITDDATYTVVVDVDVDVVVRVVVDDVDVVDVVEVVVGGTIENIIFQ